MTEYDSFGARMRHERERRQISLQSIAERTKIGISLLRGLERDDVSRWPSGIFRRSFIRAYAEATGLDAETTMREFLEQFPDPDEPHPDSLAGSARLQRNDSLRLRLADEALPFLPAGLQFNWRQRCEAIVWDLVAIAASAGILSFGDVAFWPSVALVTVIYYSCAVLLLGNTAGLSLAARRTAMLGGMAPSEADIESDQSDRADYAEDAESHSPPAAGAPIW